MRIFHSQAQVPADFGPSVVTIGNFDGVHTGHRAIMRAVVEAARLRGLVPTVLTFDPHPARILAPDRAPGLLMTTDQRLRALESLGIGAVLMIPFSREFAALTPEDFIDGVLIATLRAKSVMVGEDFRFGHRQSGSAETLRVLGAARGFTFEPVPHVTWRGERVSSSAVRTAIAQGSVSRACRMLGAPFALEGEIVKGQGIGSKQTVPTLNLAPNNDVIPPDGVYITRTRDFDSVRRWPSVTNIGKRPTFGGGSVTVETFLLSPLDDPTPARIELEFLRFIRQERKFESPVALRDQIMKDVAVATRLHRRLKTG